MKVSDIYRQTISDKNHVLNFGKYRGWKLGDVMEHDPQYLLYCQSKIDWFDLSHLILDELDEVAVRGALGDSLYHNSHNGG